MKWTEELYRDVLQHPEFRLRENDYVIGDRKFGGNAQYIKKDRWLHHTSILWDYSAEKMRCLRHPKKAPMYRADRSHEDFICRLSEYFSDKEEFITRMFKELEKRFTVREVSLDDVLVTKTAPVRQSTQLILTD